MRARLLQVAEGQWKWDEEIELEMTSAFFTGVYGMWNVYIIALMCLYAPSHKQWPIEPSGECSMTLIFTYNTCSSKIVLDSERNKTKRKIGLNNILVQFCVDR